MLSYLFHSQSRHNIAQYANPRVDELIAKIQNEMVTYGRDAYLEEAWTIVTNDFVYVPIRHGVSVFAMRKNLDILPDPFDVPRFRLARFKEGSQVRPAVGCPGICPAFERYRRGAERKKGSLLG